MSIVSKSIYNYIKEIWGTILARLTIKNLSFHTDMTTLSYES